MIATTRIQRLWRQAPTQRALRGTTVVEKIASMIAEETYYILRDHREFDEARDVARLQELT